MKLLNKYISILVLFVSTVMLAQQSPHFTQYMYNTQSINPAYVGSKGFTVINLLVRNQWVGLEGAPQTQSLSYDGLIGDKGVGLGFNIINDKIGPTTDMSFNVSGSYTVYLNELTQLSFGMSLGGSLFNIDWNKLKLEEDSDSNLYGNVNRFLPTLGIGVYLHEENWYVGASIPNFIESDYYDAKEKSINESIANKRLHMFFIAGYVFNVNENLLFKPAILTKIVSGAPLSMDVSANFLINQKFTAGLGWRLDDSISGLLGFQISKNLHLGYSYDLTTTNFSEYNSGTHELMFRYEMSKPKSFKSPRFF